MKKQSLLANAAILAISGVIVAGCAGGGDTATKTAVMEKPDAMVKTTMAKADTMTKSAMKHKREKCMGIAKAGMNDCAANGHSCAGQSKVDGGAEWIYLPVGTCERLGGGTVKT